MASEQRKTVMYAAGANVVIAVAKIIGGLTTGSSAMLAEAAHSVADTMNQVFMLVSLSLGRRPPDEDHPFGYGKERFFWAFLAAAFIFVSGAVFSVGEGLQRLLAPSSEQESFTVNYVILGVAFLSEGISWVRALRHTRGQAREAGMRLGRFVRDSRDPTVKTVLSEDSAALCGLLLAFGGILAHQLTGQQAWDGYASILIGILLALVAVALGRDTKGLLLGEAALPHERQAIREVIARRPEIDHVVELLTMALGPNSILVAARVDLADGMGGEEVERLSYEIDRELRERVPSVGQVFLDATARHEPQLHSEAGA